MATFERLPHYFNVPNALKSEVEAGIIIDNCNRKVMYEIFSAIECRLFEFTMVILTLRLWKAIKI